MASSSSCSISLARRRRKRSRIDLFEDQHLNIDHSGSGDLAKFRRNLDRHADSARLVLHQGNSMDLTGAILTRLADGPLRFVSVDGGHTAEITAHDLATAEAAIAEGGIIVVDDVFNEQWPGVGDGVRRYFERRPNLVPFAIGANKTYFCRPSHRDIYRDAAAAAASTRRRPRSSWASPSASSSSCGQAEGQGGGIVSLAAPADDADRPAAALGLAYRPHAAARPEAERRFLAVGRFFALLRVFLGGDGEIQVLAARK